MSLRYSNKVIDHFKNPRNVGVVANYNGKSITGDPDCGDFLELTIMVNGKIQQVSDVKFKCRGCPAAIASGSMLTTLVTSKDINEILCMTEMDIVNALDGLPEKKIHCSVMGVNAIRDAIADYMLYTMMMEQGLVKDRIQYEKVLEGKRVTMGTHECDGSCQGLGEI